MPAPLRIILSIIGALLLIVAVFAGLGLLGFSAGALGLFFVMAPIIIRTGFWTSDSQPIASERLLERVEERRRRERWRARRAGEEDGDSVK